MKKCDKEEKLIKDSLKGNSFAFGELVRHYEKFVYNVSLSYMSNPDDAFDVAQDSFLKAWHKLHMFKGESSFSTWLYRIVANTAKDTLEKRNKRWDTLELDESIISRTPTPEDKCIQNENVSELRRAIMLLDDDMRQILILRELSGLSYAELAEYLNIEIGTVKSRLSRARERLREILLEQNRSISVKSDEVR